MNLREIENKLQDKIIRTAPAGGGCIAQSITASGASGKSYFIKEYTGNPKVVTAEAGGLKEIGKCGKIRVPEVILEANDVLVLEYIEKGRSSAGFFTAFGRSLAKMHKTFVLKHGFGMNNFIGGTPQKNLPENSDWTEFYFRNRLEYQYYLAEKNGLSGYELEKYFGKLENKIGSILNIKDSAPSLLHGDLWGGNYLQDEIGKPVLIDPAVYYGHREADLAMTKLFGGFTPEFYKAYNDEYPLEEGWQYRENIYKLYHILNHLNLFGNSYYGQAVSLLKYYF